MFSEEQSLSLPRRDFRISTIILIPCFNMGSKSLQSRVCNAASQIKSKDSPWIWVYIEYNPHTLHCLSFLPPPVSCNSLYPIKRSEEGKFSIKSIASFLNICT